MKQFESACWFQSNTFCNFCFLFSFVLWLSKSQNKSSRISQHEKKRINFVSKIQKKSQFNQIIIFEWLFQGEPLYLHIIHFYYTTTKVTVSKRNLLLTQRNQHSQKPILFFLRHKRHFDKISTWMRLERSRKYTCDIIAMMSLRHDIKCWSVENKLDFSVSCLYGIGVSRVASRLLTWSICGKKFPQTHTGPTASDAMPFIDAYFIIDSENEMLATSESVARPNQIVVDNRTVCDTISAYDQRDAINIVLCKNDRFRKLHFTITTKFFPTTNYSHNLFHVEKSERISDVRIHGLISDTFGYSCISRHWHCIERCQHKEGNCHTLLLEFQPMTLCIHWKWIPSFNSIHDYNLNATVIF